MGFVKFILKGVKMTELKLDRIIATRTLIIHVDYVCGMEFRVEEGKMFITYKNGSFSKVHSTLKEFTNLQNAFLAKGK